MSKISHNLLTTITQTYNVVITEQQRRIIELILDSPATIKLDYKNNSDPRSIYKSDFHESELLLDMIKELPEHETKDPGIIHSFAV